MAGLSTSADIVDAPTAGAPENLPGGNAPGVLLPTSTPGVLLPTSMSPIVQLGAVPVSVPVLPQTSFWAQFGLGPAAPPVHLVAHATEHDVEPPLVKKDGNEQVVVPRIRQADWHKIHLRQRRGYRECTVELIQRLDELVSAQTSRGDTGQQSGSQSKSKRTQQMIIQTAVDHIQQIRSAARLSLEESTTVGVLVVEAPSSKVAHANKACATLMRHSSVDGSDTFGTALTDYLHPSDHTKVREALARYAAGAGDSGEKLLLRFLPGSSSNGASAELVFPPITLDDAEFPALRGLTQFTPRYQEGCTAITFSLSQVSSPDTTACAVLHADLVAQGAVPAPELVIFDNASEELTEDASEAVTPEAISRLRAEASGSATGLPGYSDAFLACFLREHKGDTQYAARKVDEYDSWKRSYDMMAPLTFERFNDSKTLESVLIDPERCIAKDGSVVVLLKPRPKTQEAGAGKDANLFIFFVFEWLITHSRRAQLRGVTLLHDWTGVAPNKTDPLDGNFFVQPMIAVLPLRINAIINFNAPVMFQIIWAAGKFSLSSELVARIKVLGQDRSLLYTLVDPRRLPRLLGGFIDVTVEGNAALYRKTTQTKEVAAK